MGRKRKVTAETAPVVVTEQETETQAKYPAVAIQPGSWRASGGRPETHGKKVTVVCICPCGAETVRATSDLWQCGSLCPVCRADARKGKAARRKQAK